MLFILYCFLAAADIQETQQPQLQQPVRLHTDVAWQNDRTMLGLEIIHPQATAHLWLMPNEQTHAMADGWLLYQQPNLQLGAGTLALTVAEGLLVHHGGTSSWKTFRQSRPWTFKPLKPRLPLNSVWNTPHTAFLTMSWAPLTLWTATVYQSKTDLQTGLALIADPRPGEQLGALFWYEQHPRSIGKKHPAMPWSISLFAREDRSSFAGAQFEAAWLRQQWFTGRVRGHLELMQNLHLKGMAQMKWSPYRTRHPFYFTEGLNAYWHIAKTQFHSGWIRQTRSQRWRHMVRVPVLYTPLAWQSSVDYLQTFRQQGNHLFAMHSGFILKANRFLGGTVQTGLLLPIDQTGRWQPAVWENSARLHVQPSSIHRLQSDFQYRVNIDTHQALGWKTSLAWLIAWNKRHEVKVEGEIAQKGGKSSLLPKAGLYWHTTL